MTDNLESMSADELREMFETEGDILESLRQTMDPDFGTFPREEVGPIDRDKALKAVEELEKAYLIARVIAQREEQGRRLRGILAKTERLKKYGLETPPRQTPNNRNRGEVSGKQRGQGKRQNT